MKLKEVCKQTGLTQKTVRFYEEKQLISPTSVIKNGRSYREYSDEDVKVLREIAVLRKALFSMDEIRSMQNNPDEIDSVLESYTQRIKSLYEHLKFLNHTVDQLQQSEIKDISCLVQELSGAARTLPLPAYDMNPKFRYLDAIEQPPSNVQKQINLDETIPSKQVFNQMVLGRMKGGIIFIFANHLTDARKSKDVEWVPAWENIPEDPPKLRVLKTVLSAAIVIFILYFIWNWIAPYDIYKADFHHLWIPFIIFVIIVIIRLSIALFQFNQRRNYWIDQHKEH